MGVPKVTGDTLSYQFGQPHSLALPAKERGEPGNEAIFWAHFHSLAPWQLYVYKHAQVLIGQLLEWEFSLSSFQACDVIYCMHQSLILFHQIRLIPRPSHRPTFDRLHYAKLLQGIKNGRWEGLGTKLPSNSIIGCSTEPAIRPYTLCSCMNIVSRTLSGRSVIEHGDVFICGRISASCVDHEQCNVV